MIDCISGVIKLSDLVGLQFPFDINGKGGLSLVKQSKEDSSIFDGKIEQLLGTGRGERAMECHIFSDLDVHVFSPNDASTRTLLEYEIKQAIAQSIPEIQVISVSMVSQEKTIIALVTYKVLAYGTTNITSVKVG